MQSNEINKQLIIHHGSYWTSIVNLKKYFSSDVENHTTGKLYILLKVSSSNPEQRIEIMQYFAESLHERNLFLHCKIANTDNNRGIVPLLFYSYTAEKEKIKEALKEIFQNIKNNKNHFLNIFVENKTIPMTFRLDWKLDSATHQEIKSGTHWTLKNKQLK